MHGYLPFYFPTALPFMFVFLPLLIAAVLAIIVLKGFVLWHAARNSQKWWFIALLVVNTFGILEIVYLIWFRPKNPLSQHTSASHTPADSSSTQA